MCEALSNTSTRTQYLHFARNNLPRLDDILTPLCSAGELLAQHPILTKMTARFNSLQIALTGLRNKAKFISIREKYLRI